MGANLRPAIHSDPDLSRGYPIPDKQATRRLLELILDRTGDEHPNELYCGEGHHA